MKLGDKLEKALFILFIVLFPVQLGKHFWPTSAFIGGLRVDYLSPTIYVSDVLLLLLLVVSAAKTDWHRIKINISRKFGVIGVLACAFVVWNIIGSDRPSTAIYVWLRSIEAAGLLLYVRETNLRLKQLLARFLPFPLLCSSLIALAQFLKGGSLGGMLYWLGDRSFSLTTPGIATASLFGRLVIRPYATFPHPNALAGFMLIAGLIWMWGVGRGPAKTSQQLSGTRFIVMVMTAGTLMLTQSLSSIVTAVMVLALWARSALSGPTKGLAAVLVVTVLITALVAFPPEPQSLSQRLVQAREAWLMLRAHPMQGVGLGNFIPNLLTKNNLYPASPFLYFQPVHNIYLLIASELGIIGALAFFWLITTALKQALGKKSKALVFALLGIFIIGIVDHYWSTLQQTRLLFAALLGLAFRKES